MIKRLKSIVFIIFVFFSCAVLGQSALKVSADGGINSGTVYTYPNSGFYHTPGLMYQFGLKYEYPILKKMSLIAGLDFSSKYRDLHTHTNSYNYPITNQLSYDYIGMLGYKTGNKTEIILGGYYQNMLKCDDENFNNETIGIRFQLNIKLLKTIETGVVLYTDVTPSVTDLVYMTHHMYNYGAMLELEYTLFEFKRK